jgi:glycosyltransferase involved in cell wall biosynthesis
MAKTRERGIRALLSDYMVEITLTAAAAGPQCDARKGCQLNISFLTVMPSPYTQDLFAAMRQDGRIRPRVYYMEMAAPDTHWGNVSLSEYERVLPGFWLPFLGGRVHFNRGTVRAIAADRPDLVVVSGYMTFTVQIVMRWLHMKRIPWVFWGEVPGMRRRRGVAAALRSLAQRPVARWSSGIAAIGSRAAMAYRQMTRDTCPVANIPYCCDMQPFFDISRQRRDAAAGVRFLYCGQLIHRKGVDLLIAAFCYAASLFPRIELVLVGDGPLRKELEEQIPDDIRPRVRFAGFQPVAELPRFFAEADVFVLPSRHDGWGVVVNQAAAAGMPIIASEAVGAAADLVIENENGHLVHADNVESLGNALASVAAHPEKIQAFGQRSREIATNWTPEKSVDRWYEFLSEIVTPATKQGASAIV